MTRPRKLIALAISVASVFLLAAEAQSADEALALRIRASQLASEGHCDQALVLLGRARELGTDDARSALLTGQCLVQGQHYGDALPHLSNASRLDPNSGDAALLLGVTAYKIGDLTVAEAALSRADVLLPSNAEVALYQGLVLLEQANSDEAAARFLQAQTISPGAVEPMASYYGGLAHHQAGRTEEAEASLRRVSELSPGSEWAVQAEAALAAPPARNFDLRQWLVLKAGVDYDSNVSLVGDGFQVASGKGDGRVVWGAQAGTELYRDEDWGIGVLADYYGMDYFDEKDFDNHYLGGGLWVDREIDDTTLIRVQPLFGLSWYDKDAFLRFYGVQNEFMKDWGDAGSGTLYVRYSYDDYLYDIRAASDRLERARNRDGHNSIAGYNHTYSLTESTEAFGGPYARYYAAKGADWDYWGLGAWLGFRQQLPWKFTAEVSGSYEFDQFDDPSTYLQAGEKRTDRHDHIGTVSVELERPITDWLLASAHWRYHNARSNTDVFDYDRYIVGVLFTASFGD